MSWTRNRVFLCIMMQFWKNVFLVEEASFDLVYIKNSTRVHGKLKRTKLKRRERFCYCFLAGNTSRGRWFIEQHQKPQKQVEWILKEIFKWPATRLNKFFSNSRCSIRRVKQNAIFRLFIGYTCFLDNLSNT